MNFEQKKLYFVWLCVIPPYIFFSTVVLPTAKCFHTYDFAFEGYPVSFCYLTVVTAMCILARTTVNMINATLLFCES